MGEPPMLDYIGVCICYLLLVLYAVIYVQCLCRNVHSVVQNFIKLYKDTKRGTKVSTGIYKFLFVLLVSENDCLC